MENLLAIFTIAFIVGMVFLMRWFNIWFMGINEVLKELRKINSKLGGDEV